MMHAPGTMIAASRMKKTMSLPYQLSFANENAADADGAPAEGENDGSDGAAENANEQRGEKTDE